MAKKLDTLRLLAILILFFSIIYCYLMVLSPKTIPYYLRFWPLPKNTNILVMGVDVTFDKERHVQIKEIGRTDTMILLNINNNNFKVNMLSIPRDTVVEIPGYGWQKINSAYFLGGPALAKETVEKFLGAPVNNYIILNTRALIKLINLMGGIRVYVDRDMYYVDNWGGLKINLKKGWQTLNGDQAHGFIRFRQDALGDLSRIQRQQEFLQTVLKKLATPVMLLKSPWIMAIAFENIKTDLSLKDILYCLNFARALRKDDINMSIVPGSFAVGELNASIWAPDLDSLHEIVNKYYSRKLLAKLEPRKIPSSAITIIDNSDDFDSVRQIMKILYKKEYTIVNVSSQKKPNITKTQIIAQKGDETGARKLGGLLGINNVYVAGTGDMMSDFTIVVCSDWRQSLEKTVIR